MPDLRPLLKGAHFAELFNALGWDHHAQPLEFPVGEHRWRLAPIAEKRGVQVFHVPPGADGVIPPYDVRKKIDACVTLRAVEHLLIYTDTAKSEQIWQWVSRPPGKPRAYREYRFRAEQTGDTILQKLEGISFTLDDEEALTLRAVTNKLKDQFDRQTVTRNFYREFSTEREKFLDFIEGITALADREWYASLMLNRLMFVYFIQAKRFLDNNDDYLAQKLREVRASSGPNQFHSFYRRFLIRLFHHGLGLPEAVRSREHPDLDALLGKIPYLNGGLFQEHEIESRHGDKIKIPDKAFERIFAFFGKWHWHLDERPIAEGNEINPDVLGYIFEQYINQKQMGAYYTKEDITGYIAKNTIVPFVLDAARERCRVAFEGQPSVWRHLAEQPEHYLYDAVRHGVGEPLPAHIAAGLNDVSKRDRWNSAAPRTHALPTETWRELIARRRRCEEVLAKLRAGEVRTAADLITLNLDIRQFAQDVIQNCDGPELLRALWEALAGDGEKRLPLSVLDPTCGSGAFLFAALDVLADLYRACLDRMAAFVGDAKAAGKPIVANSALGLFQKILTDLAAHPSADYFILKRIIVHNLYGVDIMREAVEICKLRLFLKLASQVEKNDRRDNMGLEPLPDIDFNIRAGNTLVGYATRDEVNRAMREFQGSGQMRLGVDDELAAFENFTRRCADADQAFAAFREWMLKGDSPPAEHKLRLREKLAALDAELNRYLAKDYGVSPEKKKAFDAWLDSHQPFHWFVEFYGIMQQGGFDVIIGNPPYVELAKVKSDYRPIGFVTEECGNLYALCTEVSLQLLAPCGWFGFIVQQPITSTMRMAAVRTHLLGACSQVWSATFDDRPSKLFDGMHHARMAILLARISRNNSGTHELHVTRYNKWFKDERDGVFPRITFTTADTNALNGVFPKISCGLESDLIAKLGSIRETLGSWLSKAETPHQLFYKITGVGSWFTITHRAPRFVRDGAESSSTREAAMSLPRRAAKDRAFCVLNSSLFFWFFQVRTNCRDFNPSDYRTFPVPASLSHVDFAGLAERLRQSLDSSSSMVAASHSLTGRIEYEQFRPRVAKPILDEIDRALAEHYGFTDEELDFILNYDIKYRLGIAGGDDDAE